MPTIFLFAVLPGVANAQPGRPYSIVYFNSATDDDCWWKTSADLMEAACEDLGMRLKVVYVDRNRARMVEEFRQIASSKRKPDAVVFQNLKKNALDMLDIAEANRIPAFIFNAGLTSDQARAAGGPRQKYKFWIGQMLPDDREAGYNLAVSLYREALRLGLADASGDVHFLRNDGSEADIAATERAEGFAQAARDFPRIKLLQSASADWDRHLATKVVSGLVKRHPSARVVWAANDPMALGTLDALPGLSLLPGRDIVAGSIDWVPEAIERVRDGQLVTSIGGHFMETAWVAVLLHDYLSGRDFADQAVAFKSSLASVSALNIDTYLSFFRKEFMERADFAGLSRVLHPERARYDFSFDRVLSEMSLESK